MITSLVRTATPIIVGWLLSLGFVQAAGIDGDQLSALVTGLLTVVFQVGYYFAARLVEQRFPGLRPLGSKVQPTYQDGA